MYKRQGKWDTQARVRKKRAEGNLHVVCAKDGNTYIRGRRLLKPINHPQFTEVPSDPTSDTTPAKQSTSKKTTSTSFSNKNKMPRQSPRNHNSSKAVDTEIEARLTALHIYEVQNETQKIEDEE